MKRILAVLIASALMMSLLAGCGGSKTPASNESTTTTKAPQSATTTTQEAAKPLTGKITLAIWNGQKVDAFEEDAKKFMEANPGTTIEIEFVEKIETISTRMAANEMPDICQIPREVLKVDWPDFYLPLEDIGFTADNYYFYENGLGPDGRLYNITNMISFSGIVYNKKVFAKAGITSIPKTMDELHAACDKLLAIDVVPFATNFKDKWPLGSYSIRGNLMQALTGDTSVSNNLVNTDNLMAGAFLDSLNFLRTMKEKGYVEPDLMSTNWGAFIKDMSAGKYGMTYLGSWFPPQMEDADARGMFPFPGAKNVMIGSDWRMAIAKNTNSPELAKEYFKYLFLTEKAWVKILDFCSAVKGSDYPFDFVNELVGYGVPLLGGETLSDEVQAIVNETAVDFDDITQEYMITNDPDAVIKKYNDLWAAARKTAQ